MAKSQETSHSNLQKAEISFSEIDLEVNPQYKVSDPTHQNLYGNFITGFDVTTEEEDHKRKQRALRFGLRCQNLVEADQTEKIKQEDLEQKKNERFLRFGPTDSQNRINKEDAEIESCSELELPSYKIEGDIRLNALHLHGTDEMSTKDVIRYFEKFPPGSIEWINDSSCNVIWDDENTAKRAFSARSQEISLKQSIVIRDHRNIAASTGDLVFYSLVFVICEMSQFDDKLQWRFGEPCSKAKLLLIRYATINDKKIKGIAKYSNYYLKYGNPNQHGSRKGIVTQSRKRRNQKGQEKLCSPDIAIDKDEMDVVDSGQDCKDNPDIKENDEAMEVDEPRIKRMRMRADEEDENKLKRTDLRLLLKNRRKNETYLALNNRSSLTVEIINDE
ncbi:Nuclear cap-binding protein subunit 3 [Trichoplax sp. H2]|nr:Nuclear cap-binding protein subunit 3 [Trichoplax sp. H2]|eukprot:RDD47417.1 Nuclear cap-binding protein subunit 3 [Trichoplax sp. H2]